MTAEAAGPPRRRKPVSGLLKQSLAIAGHRTSIALEAAFWRRLEAVAAARQLSLPRLVASIDARRAPGAGLSSAIRVYLLEEALAGAPADRG